MIVGAHFDLFSSGLTALRSGENRMLSAAAPIVEGDLDALPESLVGLALGKATFRVGVMLVHTADDLFQSTLDMLA